MSQVAATTAATFNTISAGIVENAVEAAVAAHTEKEKKEKEMLVEYLSEVFNGRKSHYVVISKIPPGVEDTIGRYGILFDSRSVCTCCDDDKRDSSGTSRDTFTKTVFTKEGKDVEISEKYEYDYFSEDCGNSACEVRVEMGVVVFRKLVEVLLPGVLDK